jgi:hypothetical protein
MEVDWAHRLKVLLASWEHQVSSHGSGTTAFVGDDGLRHSTPFSYLIQGTLTVEDVYRSDTGCIVITLRTDQIVVEHTLDHATAELSRAVLDDLKTIFQAATEEIEGLPPAQMLFAASRTRQFDWTITLPGSIDLLEKIDVYGTLSMIRLVTGPLD